MTTTRALTCDDLFRFNNVNLDVLTETYNMPFYLQYLAKWPSYFQVLEAPCGKLMGYVMGKAEHLHNGGKVHRETDWHGHVTAVTVAPEYRRLGLARRLMGSLEEVSEKTYNGYFVDLFVRCSNAVAINMYQKFGYTCYRRVVGYYSGADKEDAYDMRKPLARDRRRVSSKPSKPFECMPEDL